MIGRSIRHSAPGTLRALIRSLGLLTSQGLDAPAEHRSNDSYSFCGLVKVAAAGKGKASVLRPRLPPPPRRPPFYTCLVLLRRSRSPPECS